MDTALSAVTTVNDDLDSDPFFHYDHYGNPLDAETKVRREAMKIWMRMSPEEIQAYLISVGVLDPDGTIPAIYFEEPPGYGPKPSSTTCERCLARSERAGLDGSD